MGINLSGGQKQRVSLARAVYFGADVYFLDDPLSAVDSHVGKHIFERIIGPDGLLKEKTRILLTHNTNYLSEVDFIIVMKDGSISETGSFHELLNNEGDFSKILSTHLKKSSNSDEDDSSVIDNTDNDDEEIINTPEHKVTEIERMETGNLSWNTYTHYFRCVGISLVLTTFFINCFLQILSFSSNVWLSKWTDDTSAVIPEGIQDINKRNYYLSIYTLLGLSKCTAESISAVSFRIGCWIAAKALHKAILHNFFRLPLSFMDVTPGGRILSRFSKDIDVMDNSFPSLITSIYFSCGEVICNLFIICYSTPIFVTVILPILVLYCLTQRYYAATSRQLKRLESVSRSPLYSHFVETIVGAPSIRAYGLSERFVKSLRHKLENNLKSYYLTIVSNCWLSVRTDIISNIIKFFAVLFVVLDRKTISPGLAGLSIGYTLQITLAMSWSVSKLSEVETNMVSVERIKEYSQKPQEAPWKLPKETTSPNWPLKGNIDFQEFKVRYREGLDLVLKGVTAFINGGQKVGIVGRTGAGKSSLTLSLFRILESAGGKILIDGIDIATIGLHSLRSKLTIIPQDPVLFAGSLKMNLDPFSENSDDSLWRALELAHLKSHISNLNEGLQHKVAEGGENFSVGQRQLICLARALLRNTKILILDEATAAIDLETDDLIQSTLRKEFKNCTVITIAHRLNTIMDYDKILVLDNGYVVEYDSPLILLKSKNSLFYGMAADAKLV